MRGGFIDTRLRPPRHHVPLIRRTRLLNRIDGWPGTGFILLTAPTGFGKTVLMAQVLEVTGGAWLTLDRRESHVEQFAAMLASAIARVADPESPMQRSGPRQKLTAAIEAASIPLTIFLDDADIMSEAHAGLLVDLDRQFRDHVRFLIASRAPPPFRAAPHIANGRLHHIDADMLRFDVGETRRLMGRRTGDPSFRRLVARAEGWPIALQLARDWHDRREGESGSTTAAIDDASDIACLLLEEVIASLPATLVDFLETVSIVETVHPLLAEALTAQTGAARRLRQLCNLGVVIVPAEEAAGSYRIQPMLRHALRKRLDQRGSACIASLHGCASRWYENSGELASAIVHSLLSGDALGALGIVERAGGILMAFQHGMDRFRSVLASIPDSMQSEHPRLLLLRAFRSVKAGHAEEARSLHALACRMRIAAQQGGADISDPMGFVIDATIVDAFLSADRPVPLSMARQLRGILENCGTRWLPHIEAFTAIVESYACQQNGNLLAARNAARRCENYDALVTWRYNDLFLDLQRGQIDLAAGDYATAARRFAAVAEAGRISFGGDRSVIDAADAMQAEAAYLMGDMTRVRDLLPSIGINGPFANISFDARAACGALRLHLVAEDEGSYALPGLVRMLSLQDDKEPVPWIGLLASGEAAVACYWRGDDVLAALFIERAELARHWMQWTDETDEPHAPWRVHDAVGLALMLCTPDVEARRLIAEALVARANADMRLHSERRVRLFALVAGIALRDNPASVDAIAEMFGRENCQGLLRQIGPGLAAGGRVSAQHHLNAREFEILVAMSLNEANKVIARRLGISDNTVKFHAKSIFRKLRVSSRQDAVDRAHHIGLLRNTLPTRNHASTTPERH